MGRFIDLTGRTFGRLTVIGQAGYYFKPSGQKEHQWLCRCSCGNSHPIIARGSNLRKGITKSCGCNANRRRYSDHKLVDLTGRKFGKLTVIEQADHLITKNGKKKVMWLCQCKCGRKRSVKAADLSGGNTQSCGQCKYENRYVEKADYVIGYTNTGDSFIIDKDDFERVKPFYWRRAKERCHYIETFKGKQRILLHRFIIGAKKGDIVDHINGESSKAHKPAFLTDTNFNIADFFSFATRLLRKEPGKGEKGAPCMIVFCSFQQIPTVIAEAEKAGFKHAQHLSFIKKSSPQALKANMKICGATEHALLLYRDKLPKFNNIDPVDGRHHMILDWFEFERDGKEIPRIHPTQKPVRLLKRLISIFTDPGDVVIDCCAGSGSTLRAAWELGRRAYGFEVDRRFFTDAVEQMLAPAYATDHEATTSMVAENG